MASTTDALPTTSGQLTAAISTAVVQIMADHTGRGPTKAHTSIRDDLVVVLLQDTLTKSDRYLIAHGEHDFALESRRRFQDAMCDDLVAAVQRLTQRAVIAFMSANNANPDMAAELFVLEPDDNHGNDTHINKALLTRDKSNHDAHDQFDRELAIEHADHMGE